MNSRTDTIMGDFHIVSGTPGLHLNYINCTVFASSLSCEDLSSAASTELYKTMIWWMKLAKNKRRVFAR